MTRHPPRNRTCRPHRDGSPPRDEGFALAAVVMVVMLLSLVVVTLMKSASSIMVTARASADRASAESLADGLARLVTRHLSLTPQATPAVDLCR